MNSHCTTHPCRKPSGLLRLSAQDHWRAVRGRRVWIAIWLLALAFAPASAAAQTPSLAELLSGAQQAREGGDLTKCLDLLDQAYALAPSPELLNNRGKVLEELGRYDEAARAYKSVADDPNADPALRSLDASRYAALANKLNRAWLALQISPTDAEIWINGALAAPSPDGEVSAEPGRNFIELSRPGSPVVVLRRVDLPAGRRTAFKESLDLPAATDGGLALNPSAGPALSWSVDGYTLRSEISSRTVVRVAPGMWPVQIQLTSGEGLEEVARVPPATQTVVGESYAPPDPLPEPMAIVDRPPPPPSGPGPWPFVVAGVGVAMAGVGTWLVVAGANDSAEVRDARTEQRVLPQGATQVVTGVTMKRAAELEDSANLKTGLGAALLGVGAGAAVGGLLWWLLAEPDESGNKPVDLGLHPGGISIGGRF